MKWLRVETMGVKTGPWEQTAGRWCGNTCGVRTERELSAEKGSLKGEWQNREGQWGRGEWREYTFINKVNYLLHEFLNANFKCLWLFYYAKLQCKKALRGRAESLLLQQDSVWCMRNHLRTPFLLFRCFCLLLICFRWTWVMFTGMLSAFSYPTSSLWLFPCLSSNSAPSAFHVDIRQPGVFKWEDTMASAYLCLVYFT